MPKMERIFLFLALATFLLSSLVSASVVEHTFVVGNTEMERLCNKRVVPVVNGSLPGPLIEVREGDTVIVHVLNDSPYNVTIHWHGILQKLSAWADGPEFITQCSIKPGNKYTYKFNVTEQEGTLWWHAHTIWLRATVYGGFIIRPRQGNSYPFPKPFGEIPIIIGEWWDPNPVNVEKEALATGAAPRNSDTYTINGHPGDLEPCGDGGTVRFEVKQGKTYLLRIINAALNNQHFLKIANHTFTVVGIDATYVTPYKTDVVVITPGQTVDVLMTANQPVGNYYVAARPYVPFPGTQFVTLSTPTGILTYKGATSSKPILPDIPAYEDTDTAHQFYSNITSLPSARFWVPPPTEVDENMLMTIGLGITQCGKEKLCQGPWDSRFSASINNVSFELPTQTSIMEAYYYKINGIYETNFPNMPVPFDYTNLKHSYDKNLMTTTKSTSVKQVKFNTTIEIVFQDTVFLSIDNHPMHIHGFNFHVLAQGFGNFDPSVDRQKYNLVNPQIRNTIGVPTNGWAAIRVHFDNPGVWILHCHLDLHLPWGLAAVFIVEDGGTPDSTLPPPPADLPKC